MLHSIFRVAKIITIDGPAASGKSSVGRKFAHQINFQFIDSGAIYRAGVWAILQNKVSIDQIEKINQIFADLPVDFRTDDQEILVFVNEQNITDKLHSPEVTALVAQVAAMSSVRPLVKQLEHLLASRRDTVMAGRDIGTEIFPDSKLKFYITADPEVRAKRRHQQQIKIHPEADYQKIFDDMVARDQLDATREISPMRQAEDAVLIDTSHLTLEQTLDQMIEHYQKVFGS